MSETIEHQVQPDALKKDRSRNILLNTLTSYADDIVDAITMLILIPFLIKTLGKDSFGLWSLIWAFVSLFELADLGFAASIVKYVADAKGRGDSERLKKIVGTMFWVYAGIGALLLSGVLLSLLFFNRLFDIPDAYSGAAKFVLIVLGARSAMLMPLGMFRGVIAGYQKASVANVYKTIAAILYFIASLIVLSILPDIKAFAVVNLVLGVLPMIVIGIHVKKTIPDIQLSPKIFDRKIIKEIGSFSIYFTIIQVSRFIYTRVDSIIIKAFLPLEMVAVYAISMRLSEKSSQFCFQLIKNLSPVVAELHAAGEVANIRAVWERGTKLAVAFATPLLLGLAVLSEPLIRVWTGPGFELAVPACQWLIAANFLGVIHGNTNNILSMVGQQKFIAMATLASQILNIIFSILLIKPFGIVGVSIATFAVTLPLQIGVIQVKAGKLYHLSLWRFYSRTVLPSIPPAILLVGFLYVFQRFYPLKNLLEVAVLEAIGVTLFFSTFWFIGFEKKERDYFKEKVLKRLMNRPAKQVVLKS
ncbi:MAG: oligosaccharide flippase family protein [Acidobacteriota bacterium]